MATRFTYEQILHLKGQDKILEQLMLKQSLASEARETYLLQEVAAERARVEQALGELSKESQAAASLSEFYQYHDMLSREEQLQFKRVMEAQEKVREHQQELVHKSVEEKKWQKMKERFFSDLQKQEVRQQERESDDAVSRRYFTREG